MMKELIDAVHTRNIIQLQQLFEHFDISKEDASYALFEAARCGYTDIVETLIPHADPKSNASSALRAACQYKHEDIALLLIPHSNARAVYSQALFLALEGDMTDVCVALWSVSDTNHLWNMNGYDEVKNKMTHIQALYEKTVLEQHMPDKHTIGKKKL